jgi:hypothetical protein
MTKVYSDGADAAIIFGAAKSAHATAKLGPNSRVCSTPSDGPRIGSGIMEGTDRANADLRRPLTGSQRRGQLAG